MNWSILGWGMIGIAAVLLTAFSLIYKNRKAYEVRKFSQFEKLDSSRVDAIEGGLKRTLVLGHSLFSPGYPGLGLGSLSSVPGFLDPETLADGSMNIATSQGTLAVFARQIVENSYHDGFSRSLSPMGVQSSLLGPTPLSFTAGLLNEMSANPQQGLILTGNFGPEASLWSEIGISKNGYVFASAGTITSQASLYLHVKDLLIGENTFVLPGLIDPSSGKNAGWVTEDILRVLLIIMLVAGVILKLAGVL
jgi:hypothetical protein